MRDILRFSSSAIPPARRFEAYRELHTHRSEILPGREAFKAEVVAWRLGDLLVFDRRLSGVVHSRQERVNGDGVDRFVATLVRSGRLNGQARTGFEVEPGQIILFDTRRVVSIEHHAAHIVTVSVARGVIEAAVDQTDGLHGQILTAPANGFLADFMVMLAERSADMAPLKVAPVSRAFLDILSTAGGVTASQGLEQRRLDLARRRAVDRYIDDNLSDRKLSVGMISRATGVSRSALYRMFAEQGGVGRHVKAQRLAAVRKALDNGGTEPLAALAHTLGFASDSQMSRQFSRAYDTTPGAYRRARAERGADDPAQGRDQRADWMRELN